VVLPPIAVASLIAALAERFSAEALSGDGWFLRPRPDGRPAVDPRLHLQDDGAMPGGLRTRSFDDRGVAPVPLTLLREGRVDGRFVSPEAAHRLDARPTGHTRGGAQQPSNLILRSGTRSLSAALTDLGGISLQVDDLAGLPDGLDFATGQLGVRVHGVLLDGVRPIGVVRQRVLTGDLGVALNRVVEVCSDTDRIGHVDAPGLILDGLSLE
jgi:predicted Zn-dependent protease